MSRAAIRGIVIFAVGIAILLGALAVEYWRISGGEAPASAVAIGGPFSLVDQQGRTRGDGDFRGKLMLVYFGYTYCPDVCPTELQTMSDALDLLGPKGDDVVPIFVTVDPERDTPEQLALYAESFHPRLVALTGTPEQVGRAAKGYKVYYRKAEQPGGGEYLMDHSSFVFLMDRNGRYVTHFSPGATPEAMAAAIDKRL